VLFRFSLYGFLKNQRYFEPFLILALLSLNLSFFEIGLLIGFRELAANVMEIPSGAVADLWGRRRSMILSFSAYIGGFLIFGFARDLPPLFAAMLFLAIGDAFRTGTHKAMIFTWLRREGRIDERTRVYGYTRSWSKIGSAVSALAAAVFVLATDSYTTVFFFAAVPYVLNIVNFMGYPRELDGDAALGTKTSARDVFRHLRSALSESIRRAGLRRLMLESMGFEGVFQAVKHYLQPILLAAAIAGAARWGVGEGLTEVQQSAVLVGPVYFVLFLLSSAASRNAHRVTSRAGGEDRASGWMWAVSSVFFGAVFLAGYVDLSVALICAFVGLHVLQDLWRPVLISRFDEYGDESQGATILSIESQARRFATMAIAPLLGLAIDAVSRNDLGGPFWPAGLVGLAIGLVFFVTARLRPAERDLPDAPARPIRP